MHQFSSGYNSTATPQTSAPDISAILSVITQNQMLSRTQPQPAQQPSASPAITSELEAIFAQHALKNQQAPQGHMAQTHVPQMQMPQMQIPQALQGPQQPATTFDLQGSLSALQMPNQAQSAYGQAALLQIPDLQGLLSQFAQQTPAPAQNYAYGTGYQNADNERKRQLDYDDSGSGDYRSKGKRQKNEAKKKVRLLSCKSTRALENMLMSNLMRSTLAFPGFLANFGRRENAERETSAHIFMSRNVIVSPPGAGPPHPGVDPSRCVRWLNLVWRRDMLLGAIYSCSASLR